MGELIGMQQICNYIELSEATVMHLIQFEKFPAQRGDDAVWKTTSEAIDKWNGSKEAEEKKAAKADDGSKKQAEEKPEPNLKAKKKKKFGR